MTDDLIAEVSIVWCVKHRTGWCARRRDAEPSKGSREFDSMPTLCDHFVISAGVVERRVPMCPDRAARLRGRRKGS